MQQGGSADQPLPDGSLLLLDLEEPVAAIVHVGRAGAGRNSRAAADAAMSAAAGSSSASNCALHTDSEALLVFARSGRVVVLRPSRDFALLAPQRFRVLDSYLRLAAVGRAAARAEAPVGAAKLLVQVSVQLVEGCDYQEQLWANAVSLCAAARLLV